MWKDLTDRQAIRALKKIARSSRSNAEIRSRLLNELSCPSDTAIKSTNFGSLRVAVITILGPSGKSIRITA